RSSPGAAMKVAVTSARSSPGATTLVQALALSWPNDRRLLLAEADGSGGTLAARLHSSHDPGLVSLASSGRRVITPSLMWQHCQRYGGVEVLLSPGTALQTNAALQAVGDALWR